MSETKIWDPVWGPRVEPKPRRLRMAVKRTLARLLSVGRSPADPSRGVAILAYHGTGAERGEPWWLDFPGQMSLLADLGYEVVPLDRALAVLAGDDAVERPTAAITFDDGFANNHGVAYPELARRGWPATVFVTSSWIGRPPYMSPDEVRALAGLGIDAGNHTHSHPSNLTAVDSAEIVREIAECSRRLEDLTGRTPRHFCYPNGHYDRRVRDAVASAGLRSACSGRVGFSRIGQDPLALSRLTVERGDGARELRARLAGGYDFLDLRQRRRNRA